MPAWSVFTRRDRLFTLVVVLALLTILYAPTLLTINNGSSDDLMNDAGEVQVVLNTWGTLHATGYPLFCILGSAFVALLRALGMSPLVAPTVFSLVWGWAASALIFALAVHLTGRTLLSAAATLLYGLTYYTWLYNAVPAVRTMGLALEVLLLIVALRRPPIPQRLYWLALIGGIGIAHHRAFIFFVPAILYAVWPELVSAVRKRPLRLVVLGMIGLIGFLPYLYLPWRANAGATWAYGEPNTWAGFWDQFLGHEASQMFGLNTSPELVRTLFDQHLDLVTKEVTGLGIVVGLVGLGCAIREARHRRAAITLLLISLVPFAFDMFGTQDHLPPFIMTFALSLVFGWLLLFDVLLASPIRRYARIAIWPAAVAAALGLAIMNFPIVYDLCHDPTGTEAIAFAARVPAGATLMLDWGARYFAVGFAQDVLGQLGQIHRVDHKGDFIAIAARGMLVTPDYSFYEHPRRWWRDKLQHVVYLRAVAPHLIQIDTAPQVRPPAAAARPDGMDPSVPVIAAAHTLRCGPDTLTLQVDWWALAKPPRDKSVLVHLLESDGRVLAQDDQSAPVYGWRPLTSFEAGEVVRDLYTLPRVPGAASVQFGLYEKMENGEFKNDSVVTIPVACSDGNK